MTPERIVFWTVVLASLAPFAAWAVARATVPSQPGVHPIRAQRFGWIVAALLVSTATDLLGVAIGPPNWWLASIYPTAQLALLVMVLLPVVGHRMLVVGAFVVGSAVAVRHTVPGETTILCMASFVLLVLIYNEHGLGQTMRRGLFWFFGATLPFAFLMSWRGMIPDDIWYGVFLAYQMARTVGTTVIALAIWERRERAPATSSNDASARPVAVA